MDDPLCSDLALTSASSKVGNYYPHAIANKVSKYSNQGRVIRKDPAPTTGTEKSAEEWRLRRVLRAPSYCRSSRCGLDTRLTGVSGEDARGALGGALPLGRHRHQGNVTRALADLVKTQRGRVESRDQRANTNRARARLFTRCATRAPCRRSRRPARAARPADRPPARRRACAWPNAAATRGPRSPRDLAWARRGLGWGLGSGLGLGIGLGVGIGIGIGIG